MITTASLFCGAGGESAGRELAFEQLGIDTRRFTGLALNHWDLAVGVHGRNFPHVRVVQEDITAVTAADFGLKHIDLLWASPSCVHHSRARGGKPREEQQRSHAWQVVERWLRVADVDVFLMENVPEFQEWGPLYDTHSDGCDGKHDPEDVDENGFPNWCFCHFNKPIPARKGEYFRAFVDELRGLGYEVDYRVLCAADYGDPTTRRRLFLQAVKDGRGIHWPQQTHRDPRKATGLFDTPLPPWRAAAECIDWSIPCPSIFDRKRPLAAATLRRIAAGIQRYVIDGKPFLVNLTHGGRVESLEDPLKTITGANRGEKALVTPYIVNMRGTSASQISGSACDITEPLKTISCGGTHAALIVPFLERNFGGPGGFQAPAVGIDQPLPTVTANSHTSLIAATIVGIDNKSASNGAYSIDNPLGTQTTKARHCLVATFLTEYYGSGSQDQDLSRPLRTVRTHDCHALVTVEIDGQTYAITDIGMRMLEPHELARAMGFPDDYQWLTPEGSLLTKADRVKMIGNACPVNTVAALIRAVVMARGQAFGMMAA